MLRKSTITQLLFSFLAITVSGCAGSGLPSSAAAATVVPTGTPTAKVIPTHTVTATASRTDTPTPSPIVLTFVKNAFCRKGPSTQYFDVGSFKQGDTAQADGRNDTDPRWWYVLKPNGEHCWVSETTVQPNAAAEALPVQLPEKALPQTPPDLHADRICKPAKGFIVNLIWTPSSTADGYYVYLNGEQVQDIKKPTQTSYVIKLPMHQPVSYALEAYNSIGSGQRLTIEDPGCP